MNGKKEKKKKMNQSFAIRQQWLPPGVANCMVFNFSNMF